MHYDTAATHSKRGVTALIYVTEDWQPGHGGELVLHPYPLPEAHVRPVSGTLALFCATETLHRVAPCHGRRVCLSVWFAAVDSSALLYPTVRAVDAALGLGGEDDAAKRKLRALLGSRQSRRALAKISLHDAYRESFVAAFGDSPEVREALALDAEATDAARQVVPAALVELGDALSAGALIRRAAGGPLHRRRSTSHSGVSTNGGKSPPTAAQNALETVIASPAAAATLLHLLGDDACTPTGSFYALLGLFALVAAEPRPGGSNAFEDFAGAVARLPARLARTKLHSLGGCVAETRTLAEWAEITMHVGEVDAKWLAAQYGVPGANDDALRALSDPLTVADFLAIAAAAAADDASEELAPARTADVQELRARVLERFSADGCEVRPRAP